MVSRRSGVVRRCGTLVEQPVVLVTEDILLVATRAVLERARAGYALHLRAVVEHDVVYCHVTTVARTNRNLETRCSEQFENDDNSSDFICFKDVTATVPTRMFTRAACTNSAQCTFLCVMGVNTKHVKN